MKLIYILFALVVNLNFAQKSPAKSDEKDFKPVEIKAVDLEHDIVMVPVEENDYDVPFTVVEKIPMFQDCEDIDNEQNKKCFELKIKEHISKNLKNPVQEESETKTRILAQIIIKKDGSISDIKIRCRNNIYCEAYEKEAIRVVKLLPNLKPATQRGKVVNVSYVIPIIFNQKFE